MAEIIVKNNFEYWDAINKNIRVYGFGYRCLVCDKQIKAKLGKRGYTMGFARIAMIAHVKKHIRFESSAGKP